jgi:hypothetical protein
MPTSGKHSEQTYNHRIESWVYADAAEREGASGFFAADVGRIAFQESDSTYWRLTATTPTWVIVGGADAKVAILTVEGDLAGTVTGHIRIYNLLGRDVTIHKVFVAADTAPSGADIIVDVNQNGTTIFTDQAHRPHVAAGANTGSTTTIDEPTWQDGHYLTADIDQIGSGTPGSNISIFILYS